MALTGQTHGRAPYVLQPPPGRRVQKDAVPAHKTRPNKRGQKACKQNVGRSKNPASLESCSQRVNTTSPTLPKHFHQSNVPQLSLAADHAPLVPRSGYWPLPRPQVLILKVFIPHMSLASTRTPPHRSPKRKQQNCPGPPRSATTQITPPHPCRNAGKEQRAKCAMSEQSNEQQSCSHTSCRQ